MQFSTLISIIILSLLLTGCNAPRTINTPTTDTSVNTNHSTTTATSSNLNEVKPASEIYEGTYTFRDEEHFINGKTGRLWFITFDGKTKSDFYAQWSALQSANSPKVARVKLRGITRWNDGLSSPEKRLAEKLNVAAIPYKLFQVTDVVSVTIPSTLKPKDCYRDGGFCSSDELANPNLLFSRH